MNKFRRFMQWLVFGDADFYQKIAKQSGYIFTEFRNEILTQSVENSKKYTDSQIEKIKHKFYINDDLK